MNPSKRASITKYAESDGGIPMQPNDKPDFVLYFPSTHWDREWYRTFQDFRIRLVRVFGEILRVLETDPSFSTFITDGQTTIVADYLEAMPQDRERVQALLASGRLLIGPWYTMPDENLISGESIIKNLYVGSALAQKLAAGTRVMPLGYVCDIFGHIAQLPQILNGCGIKTVILGRGTNRFSHPAFFRWQGPAGSACAVFKLPEAFGYGTFGLDVFAAVQDGEDVESEITVDRAAAYIASELSRTELPLAVLMDGMDHEGIHAEAPWLMRRLEERFGCPVKIGQVGEFIERLLSYWEKMPQVSGELQAPAKEMNRHNKLISNTLSSRYDIKLLNDQAQARLEKAASPLLALARIRGISMPEALLETAYGYLLQNHAHDSICGCSIDEVHEDMVYRFHQALQIGESLSRSSLHALYSLHEQPVRENSRDLRLTVFNYQYFDTNRVFHAVIDFPLRYPSRFDEQVPSEPVNNFRIFDSRGCEIPCQILKYVHKSYTEAANQVYPKKADQYHVLMQAPLPALAAAGFAVKPADLPVRSFDSMKTSSLSAENGFLRISVGPDGSVTLKDLRKGYEYPDVLRFADNGETGDGWHHRAPVPDCTVHSAGAPVAVETTADGPLACAFRLTRRMTVPARMTYHRQYTQRSGEYTELTVAATLTLLRDCPYILLHIEVDNAAKDHRLLLSLASGIDSAEYEADQAFAFVRRSAGRNMETHNWKEPDKTEKAFGNVVVRRRPDASGFAFISRGGMHEAAVCTGPEGAIDITLLRCFGKTFLKNEQSAGQLEGSWTFDAALYPFSSETTNAQLLDVRDFLQTGVFCYTQSLEPGENLPLYDSPVKLRTDDEIRISVFKPSGDGQTALRLVNYGRRGSCYVELAYSVRSVYLADLLENRQQAIPHDANGFSLELEAGQIQTVLLEPEA